MSLFPLSLAVKFPNSCNGTVIPADKLDGELSLNGQPKPGSSCVWTISNVTGVLTFIVDNHFVLDKDDVLNVTRDNISVGVPSLKDLTNRLGVIFTNATDINVNTSVTVTLTISSAAKIQRTLGLRFTGVTNKDIELPVEAGETYHIPLTNVTGKKGNKEIESVTFRFPVKGFVTGKKQLIEVEQNDGSPTVLFGNSDTPGTGLEFDALGTDLTKPISLSLTKFDPLTQRIVLTADLVDSSCSKFSKDLNEKFIISGDQLTPGQSLNCIRIIQSSSAAIRLDYTKLASLLGSTDLLTIQSGGSEFSSPVIARIDADNLQSIKKDVRKQISAGKNLRISYTSHFVSKMEAAPEIAFTATTASRILSITNISQPLTITDEKDAIFLIEVASGSLAKYEIKDPKATKQAISFFSSAEVSTETKAFLVIPADQVRPDVVVSPSNIMRVAVSGPGSVDGNANFESSDALTEATAIGDEDSVTFLTSSIKPGSSATWLIPSRIPATGSISLDVKSVTLDVTGSSLTVTRLGKERTEIVKEEWQSRLTSQSNKNLPVPEIVLSPAYSYLVRYTRGPTSTTNIPIALAASFSYSAVNGCSFDRNLTREDADNGLEITPAAFPMHVPVVDPEIYSKADPKDSCGWRVNSSVPHNLVHTVFKSLDLGKGQVLTMKFDGQNVAVNETNDLLANSTLMIDLKTPISSPSGLLSQTGRGFDITVDEVPCGGVIDTSKTKQITTPRYPAGLDVSRCLWIVKGKGFAAYYHHVLTYFLPSCNQVKREKVTCTTSRSSLDPGTRSQPS